MEKNISLHSGRGKAFWRRDEAATCLAGVLWGVASLDIKVEGARGLA